MAGPAGLVGSTILHYRVLERLGGGGMGDVYLAEDSRLGRRAALKFLASTDQTDPDARARLVREAQAAAVLRSPHIAVTYDLLEHGKSLFIAMEYVEGEVLSARIGRGPLPIAEALEIALQVADALDEAHAAGIVHRDIKSANLILTSRQLVKVLDFGLAKFLHGPRPDELQTMANVTMPGTVLGTLNYMAPEQLMGGAIDHRVDLFSLGVVLFEMLTGRLPFKGNSIPEIAKRIAHDEPEALARYNYAIPSEVEAVVRKALEKTPDYRFQSAREMYGDLLNARRRLSSQQAASGRSSTWRSFVDFSDPAGPMPVAPPGGRQAGTAQGDRLLAVLAFANITGNPEDDWIGQGIAETLTADLKSVRGLSIIPREQIFDQLRNLSTAGRAIDERKAIELGRRLGAWWVLTGGYQHLGPRVRITANVVEVLTGSLASTVKLDGALEQLFDLQDQLVMQIAKGVELEMGTTELAAVVKTETRSMEAYEAYSRGILNLRLAGRESIERAISLFERAMELDGDYAEAIAGLGAAYQLKAAFLSLKDLNAKGVELLRRALAIKPDLVEAKARLGMGLLGEGDVDGAVALLEEVVRAQPDNSQARGTLGRAYWVGQGRVDEAIRELQEAVALNPEAGYAHLQLALLYAMSGRLSEAETESRAAIRLQEQAMSGTQGLLVVGAHGRLGYVHYLAGRYEAALGEYRRELEFLGATDHALRERTLIELHQKMGAAQLKLNRPAEAAEHFARAQKAFGQRLAAGGDDPFTRYYMAVLAALRGDAEAARAHLEKPLAEVSAFTRWRVPRDRDFDQVRETPPFKDLAESVPTA